ncbi:hypothetical protein ASC97_05740 [Rhizobium sp. Root1203]|nr:hypothetical protein ASC97_05740 [Rhizobium sp. Root1203]
MPYHRRYHGDALQGYTKLDLEQRGAYTTILDLIYDAGGPIDNNERWLSGQLNCSLRKVRALLSDLLTMRKIFINSQGQISNHRCETEIENALKISRKRAESAMKPRRDDGDNARFRNKISDGEEQMQRNSSVIPEPEPYISNSSPSVGVAPEGEIDFSRPPLSSLTTSDRLIRALNGDGKGRQEMMSLIASNRLRRVRGLG